MEVAVIGAGISGLSSALELQKLGIVPTIFERKSNIGQDMNVPIVTLKIFERTIRRILKYIKTNYDFDLFPTYPCKKITMISANRKTVVKGNLGYIFQRGEDKFSIENQIAANLNQSIQYNSSIDLKDIKKNFDYIISATGDNVIAKQLDVWATTFKAFTRIATVIGDFEAESVKIWFNTRFAKNCFCFLTPINPKQAFLVLTVDNITQHELNFYWHEFLLIEKVSYPIIDICDHEQTIGYSNPIHIDNVYITGNPSGAIDDALGFGSFNAIESGIFAARSIVNKLDYNKMMKPVLSNVKKICEYRKAVNNFDDTSYDKLLSFIGLPVIKQLIYNNPLSKVRYASILVKAFNKINEKKQ